MYEFDKCHVADRFGHIVAVGYIMESESGIMRMRTHDSSRLYPGQSVTLFVLNGQKGECRFSAEVQSTDPKSAAFRGVLFLGAIQKRSNTRVSRQIKFTLHTCIRDGREVPLAAPIDITMLNISAQGMYFSSDQDLEEGFTFPLDFKETRRPVHLIVRVIRRENYKRGTNYGCVFEISEKDMDEIFRFVLKEQIEQRRKRMVF